MQFTDSDYDVIVEAITAYDRIVRRNDEGTGTVLDAVIADDTGEVVYEIADTALDAMVDLPREEQGGDDGFLTDRALDLMQAARGVYRAMLRAEREPSTTHRITIEVTSERTSSDLRALVLDTIHGVQLGDLGDPADAGTFTVPERPGTATALSEDTYQRVFGMPDPAADALDQITDALYGVDLGNVLYDHDSLDSIVAIIRGTGRTPEVTDTRFDDIDEEGN